MNAYYNNLKDDLNQLRATITNKQQLIATQSEVVNKLKAASTTVNTKITATQQQKQQERNESISTVKPTTPSTIIRNQTPSNTNREEESSTSTITITNQTPNNTNQEEASPTSTPIEHSPVEPEQPYEINLDYLTADEKELARLVNEYRVSLGLEPFTISKSLTIVARTHVVDSNLYSPENGVDERGIACNCHSWSNNGSWAPVCYTSDHQYAQLMWDKPRELTDYPGNGYEISVWSTNKMTPSRALDRWKGSSGHNNVIIGDGYWASLTTMGVGINGRYAHIWFGTESDPASPIE